MTGKLYGFWMVVVPFFLLPLEVYSITFRRSVCLEVMEEFISDKNPCSIQLKEVKKWLTERSGTSTCGSQPFCRVYFTYSSSEEELYYQFEEVIITIINGFSGVSTKGTQSLSCSGFHDEEKTLSIIVFGGCVNDNQCTETENCLMYNSKILNKIGKCVCTKDNVRINGICRKVDVELGESCVEDFQCSKAGYNRICDIATSTCLCDYGFLEVNGSCINSGCIDDMECGESEKCLMYNYGTLNGIGTCVCTNDTVRINGICRKVDVELGESCDEDIQCSKAGYNRICSNSSSTCLCVNGYTEVNGYCIRTGLEVNQTCWFDEQCNGTVNSSVCRKNVCVCMAEHYYADGSCQPLIKELPGADLGTSDSQRHLQENKDSSIAQIVAAVIGGFVSGILTCFAAVYVLKLRNRRQKQNRHTEAKFVNNISYEKEIPTKVQKDSRNLEQTKISHVRPIIKGNLEHSNVSEPKPQSNDIYNHLNEKMEEDADMDVYDRALPVTAGMSPDEEYTNLSRCAVQSVRLQTAIGAQDDYAVAKIPEDVDDYSYLERQ